MEYDSIHKVIYTDKILNELDKFTIDFIKILEKYTSYVIVSGYVSILLGRSRASEDVDLLIPLMSFDRFSDLFKELLHNNYECANTSIVKEAFEMLDHHAIRFYKKGMPIPNIEFKKMSNSVHTEAFNNKIRVQLKEERLFISPLELQIVYKLSMMAKGQIDEISSDKDFEDAKHLYEHFKDKLDIDKLIYYVNLFKVQEFWELLQK